MCTSLLRNIPAAVALALLFSASSALGAASVSVTPAGDTTYYVQGTALDGVAGIQMDISYDTASLSTPTVTQGGAVAGAMLAANSSRPGLIKIAVISSRAFSGSGQIAAITFASRTGSGGITAITTSMIDSSGAALPSSGTISGGGDSGSAGPSPSPSPAVPSSQTVQSGQTGQTVQGGQQVGTSQPTMPGTVTLPTDQQQRVDPGPPPADPVPAYTEPAAAAAEPPPPPARPSAETKAEETLQYVVYKGVLDRFRMFTGVRDLTTLAALFDKRTAQTIRQEPPLLLSNGTNRALLIIDIPARISAVPLFEIQGGTLLSFKKEPQVKGRWLVDVLPAAGAVRTVMTLIAGAEEFEYPLTVAPPLKTALTLDEQGWAQFLRETGTESAPLHDFNSDGERDYIDEYIFVAHYILGKVK